MTLPIVQLTLICAGISSVFYIGLLDPLLSFIGFTQVDQGIIYITMLSF